MNLFCKHMTMLCAFCCILYGNVLWFPAPLGILDPKEQLEFYPNIGKGQSGNIDTPNSTALPLAPNTPPTVSTGSRKLCHTMQSANSMYAHVAWLYYHGYIITYIGINTY